MDNSVVRFVLKDGLKKSNKDFEDFKVQIQRIDGTVVKLPCDYSYVDVTIPEGNYNLISLPAEYTESQIHISLSYKQGRSTKDIHLQI